MFAIYIAYRMKENSKPSEVVTLNFLGLKIELKNPGFTSVIILLLVLSFLATVIWIFRQQGETLVTLPKIFK